MYWPNIQHTLYLLLDLAQQQLPLDVADLDDPLNPLVNISWVLSTMIQVCRNSRVLAVSFSVLCPLRSREVFTISLCAWVKALRYEGVSGRLGSMSGASVSCFVII